MKSIVLCILLWQVAVIKAAQLPRLRDLAEQRGIFIGAAADASRVYAPGNYSTVLAQQYNLITPESEMKWKATEPNRNQFNFTNGDILVDFAKKYNQAVRGHNLCWGNSNPDWLVNGGFSPSEKQDILKNHIVKVVDHYKGKLYCWDVVNEAVADEPTHTSYLKDNVWYPDIPNYIELAFQWAHEADPSVKLFYNDYNGEQVGDKSDAIYNMVKDFKARGVPVHGVGLQYHVSLHWSPNLTKVAENIQRLHDLGLEVHITELDVSTRGGEGNNTVVLAEQGQLYSKILKTCLEYPNCKSFETWGFTDRYTWLAHEYQPLPFDENFNPKPAFFDLASTLKQK